MSDIWYTPSYEIFTFEEMIKSIQEYILRDTTAQYEVIVGTDSQTHHRIKSTKYVTAIAVRRVGRGGKYFFKKEYQNATYSLRQKMWTEAISTYNTLEQIKGYFSGIIDESKIISHLDVGKIGKSKKYIEEITNMFAVSGYNFEIKPNSYVASVVADKHSK